MAEIFQTDGDKPLTAWGVASRAHWTRRKVSLQEIAPQHRRLALAETIAHLELLRAEGRLVKEFAPGQMLYKRAPSPEP